MDQRLDAPLRLSARRPARGAAALRARRQLPRGDRDDPRRAQGEGEGARAHARTAAGCGPPRPPPSPADRCSRARPGRSRSPGAPACRTQASMSRCPSARHGHTVAAVDHVVAVRAADEGDRRQRPAGAVRERDPLPARAALAGQPARDAVADLSGEARSAGATQVLPRVERRQPRRVGGRDAEHGRTVRPDPPRALEQTGRPFRGRPPGPAYWVT